MRCPRVLTRLRRLIGGNVAVAAAACLAPLLILVGELTDRAPPPAPAAHLRMAPAGLKLDAPLRGPIYPLAADTR